jgi:hypothetical protein
MALAVTAESSQRCRLPATDWSSLHSEHESAFQWSPGRAAKAYVSRLRRVRSNRTVSARQLSLSHGVDRKRRPGEMA